MTRTVNGQRNTAGPLMRNAKPTSCRFSVESSDRLHGCGVPPYLSRESQAV